MATAHIGQDRLIPLVQNFSTGRASSFRGDSRRYQLPITICRSRRSRRGDGGVILGQIALILNDPF